MASLPLNGDEIVVAVPGAVGVSTMTLVMIPVSLPEVYGPVLVRVVASLPLNGDEKVVTVPGAVGVSTITLVMIPVSLPEV